MLEPVEKPEVTKKGVLKKLGGGGGGHKNWRDRFFVLSDHLYYYSDESAFNKGKDPLGVVALNAYSCGVDTNTESKFGFQVRRACWPSAGSVLGAVLAPFAYDAAPIAACTVCKAPCHVQRSGAHLHVFVLLTFDSCSPTPRVSYAVHQALKSAMSGCVRC